MKAGKWLVWVGSGLLTISACMHLYGYTFTDNQFAGSHVNPQMIAAFKAISLAFFWAIIFAVAILTLATRTVRAKKFALIAVLIPVADVVLMYHFLGLFVGTIAMLISTTPTVVGVLLLPSGENQTQSV
jgi:hypothetical protein